MVWRKQTQTEIRDRVVAALERNKSYLTEQVLGVPASYLDPQVFSQDDRILKDAPFLTTLVSNPNHIGCHTLDNSESFFRGTHNIERDVISICAEDILKAERYSYDGYVSSGGTEANIQAIWIYRNYFILEFKAKHEEIAILCSENSHYSMKKASNLLNIGYCSVPVNKDFNLTKEGVRSTIELAKKGGVKYFIVVANMMTTMFGSVDDTDIYTNVLRDEGLPFKLHVDAAFGGFYYPFSNPDNKLNFANKYVDSVTMDAHKMAQAPYGTGIFLIRKGYMKYANTKEASYVLGEDSTLIGSRSGANAVSIWMILSKYGPNGWMEKVFVLQKRTDWLCDQLSKGGINFYRNPFSNIVTIKAESLSKDIAEKFGLVPDDHDKPIWYKVVVMDHVTIEKLEPFVQTLETVQV